MTLPHILHPTVCLCIPWSWHVGAVELLRRKVDLPEGLSQVFLALGFLIDSIIMNAHSKELLLDQSVHQILYTTMLATAAFVIAELAWPHAFLVSCGRCLAILTQVSWWHGWL